MPKVAKRLKNLLFLQQTLVVGGGGGWRGEGGGGLSKFKSYSVATPMV